MIINRAAVPLYFYDTMIYKKNNNQKKYNKGQASRNAPSTKLSREQLIHRIEMIREKLEENPLSNTSELNQQLESYREQLKKYD